MGGKGTKFLGKKIKIKKIGMGKRFRGVSDTDLAGHPAAEYPANNFVGYRISG